MESLITSVGGEELLLSSNPSALETSMKRVEPEELEQILDFVRHHESFSSFVAVARGRSDYEKVSVADQPTSGGSLEDSWLMVKELDREAEQYLEEHKDIVQVRPSFFNKWPSFGVYRKLSTVTSYTGAAFCYGYVVGAQIALSSMARLAKHPMFAIGLSSAAAFTTYLSPQLVLRAVAYVAIGGLASGAATATPILVIGSTGVFVASGVYHAYVATKRGISRAFLEPKSAPLLERPKVVQNGDLKLIENYSHERESEWSPNSRKEERENLLQ
eukprot:TRINITY_DN4673_c0_g1_i1.p1 TRINITY_DN4673_c0_g1~~TRINITY_DN4673_c0_g1_i1.p1  ORF type:complete len:300 (+),score=58.37 TRINITY_DN4673_c0_g1_i1:83-901(+)